MKLKSLSMTSIVLMLAGSVFADPPSWSKDVLPLFEKHCTTCHGDDRAKGGLTLATFEGLMEGGYEGAAIVPGNAAESRLVKLIEHTEEPYMPPPRKGDKLSDEEITTIRRWIDAGAKKDAPDATPAPPATPAVEPVQVKTMTVNTPQPVTSLAFSPDGKLLAVGKLHVVELLDAATGDVLRTLEGHAESVRALAFSPDGTSLAAAGGEPAVNGEVKVWNVSDGALLTTITGHADAIYGLAFSPDGANLVTSSYDRLINTWNVADGQPIHEFKNHVDAVYDVAYTPDGKRLISVAADRSVKLWDAVSHRHLFNLTESTQSLLTLALRPNSNQIAAAGEDKMIRVWSLAETTGKLVGSTFAHDAPVIAIAYSPDGKYLYSTAEDNLLKIWDADTLAERYAFDEQSDWGLALAVSPTNGSIAVGRYDGSLTVYDPESKQPVIDQRPESPKPLAPDAIVALAAGKVTNEQKDGKKDFMVVDDFIAVDIVRGAVAIPPGVGSINPNVGSRGSTVTATIHGNNLDGLLDVISGDPATRVRIIENKALPIPEIKRSKDNLGAVIVDERQPYDLKVEIDIGFDARPGIHTFQLRTKAGTSNGVNFYVEDLIEVAEKEPNDEQDNAQPITRSIAVVGTMNTEGDVDVYRFDAQAGQTWAFDIVGKALGSSLSDVMEIRDAEGNLLATNSDFDRNGDAFVAIDAPRDGTYFVSITDSLMRRGMFYRMRVEERTAVTRAFPIGVQKGEKATVEIAGVGLGDLKSIEVTGHGTPGWGHTDALPVPGKNGGVVTNYRIAVGDHPVIIESEPNDDGTNAQPVEAPLGINGRIYTESDAADVDTFKFVAKKGSPLIIDVTAQRVGSRLDSYIEVLHADATPVERAVLRPVAETWFVLADRNSRQAGFRLNHWDDFRVDDYLMAGTEVVRISQLPDYADEDVILHARSGQRIGYLDTTPEYHAVDSKVYKVEIHPPGSTFAPNGMPLIRVNTQNDDGGAPTYNKDSQLTFDPPEDGEYLVRIRSTTGDEHPDYAYFLQVRPARPDFTMFIGPADVNICRGSRALLTASTTRRDGFNEPIHIKLNNLPEGFTATETTILPGEESAAIVLTALDDAQSTPDDKQWQIKAPGTAVINGEDVTREGSLRRITVAERTPDVELTLEPSVVQLAPGGRVDLTVHVTRNNGFAGRVQINVQNLPHGVVVANTGLNGVLVTEAEEKRTFTLLAEKWVPSMERTMMVTGLPATRANMRYDYASNPVQLIVGPPSEREPEKKAPQQVAQNPEN